MKNDTIEDILIIGLAAAVTYFVIKDLAGGFGTNKSSAGLPSFSKIPTSSSSGSGSSGNNFGYNFNPFSSTPSQILGPSWSQIDGAPQVPSWVPSWTQISSSLGIGPGETS
jgi:hypothetical protein